MCENEIISPTAEGKAGVHLFLVGKHSPGADADKEGNEGWKTLKKEYEKQFGIKIEEKNKQKQKANGNYLIDNDGYDAFKEKEDEVEGETEDE